MKKGTCTSIRGTNLAPLHLRVGVAVCFIFCSRLGCVERERFSKRTAHRCASVSCALPSRWRARGPAHHTTCWEPATGPPVLINQAVALKRVRGRRLDVFFPRMSFFLRAFCTLSRLPSVKFVFSRRVTDGKIPLTRETISSSSLFSVRPGSTTPASSPFSY